MECTEQAQVWSAIRELRMELEALGDDVNCLDERNTSAHLAETAARQRDTDRIDMRLSRLETAVWSLERKLGK